MTRNSLLAVFCFLGLAGVAESASAIECNGNFQIQRNGDQIATPYCQDGYLAIVANEYGMKTSAKDIRSNYGEKERACLLAGDDIRVYDTCSAYRYRRFDHRIRR